MKHLKTYEQNNIEKESIADVISKYIEKYPEFTNFFNSLIAKFPSKVDFDDRLLYYFDEEDDDDKEYNEDDDDEFERRWDPESEVNMLESEVNGDYPGSEIWTELFNDLCDTNWNNL